MLSVTHKHTYKTLDCYLVVVSICTTNSFRSSISQLPLVAAGWLVCSRYLRLITIVFLEGEIAGVNGLIVGSIRTVHVGSKNNNGLWAPLEQRDAAGG